MKELDIVDKAMEEGADIRPIETPDTERGALLNASDPMQMLASMERLAEIAPRMADALGRIIIAFTDVEDLTVHGRESSDASKWKICLSSASAERVARPFPYRIISTEGPIKEEWSDEHGTAYGYRYKIRMELNFFGAPKEVLAEGAYHTRKPFKGKVGGEWRPVEDIDREDIRSAAFHIALGNAFKTALGLRNLSYTRWKHLIERGGRTMEGVAEVKYGNGTKGGSTEQEKASQEELSTILRTIVDAGFYVEHDREKDTYALARVKGTDTYGGCFAASLSALSEFAGKDGQWVGRTNVDNLKGKWLYATLGRARKAVSSIQENSKPESEKEGNDAA